jgi:hypothetical protein
MHYVVDTYNLLHAAAPLGGAVAELSVRKLCQFIAAAPGKFKATLVLDGRAKPDEPSPNEFPDIPLVYSGAGVTADAVIAQLVERAASRKKLVVVSNDRAVAGHARRHYAAAIGCDEFIRRLTQYNARAAAPALPAKKVTGTPTTGESDHWMKEFGLGGGEGEGAKPPQRPTPTGNPEIDDLDIEGLLGPPGAP